nr:type I-E CRISPR-associated protein Cas6/Cse3/CasE [Streptomyces alboflavus]
MNAGTSLARIQINPDSREVQRDLRDATQMHKTLMRAVPDHLGAQAVPCPPWCIAEGGERIRWGARGRSHRAAVTGTYATSVRGMRPRTLCDDAPLSAPPSGWVEPPCGTVVRVRAHRN